MILDQINGWWLWRECSRICRLILSRDKGKVGKCKKRYVWYDEEWICSQKKPTRPELEHIEFDDYAAEASETIQFAMLKDNIKSFVIGLEDLIGNRLIERTDDKSETVAAGMLNTYLNMVDSVSDMYVDYLDMFTKIKAFIEWAHSYMLLFGDLYCPHTRTVLYLNN